ncbi:hypothetical protein [Desulfurispira natronophila]|uniref:MSHA biogenesis protein MshI n=1 Tax=Desulfurispira natronophila TaxID=682562 RepID=A0A7W7Y3R4_9BACT|nr:hypothetical protein [Desulfurispira natronophila]MBB5021267.1 MSHA biogenesis protein MshI [Desulfurispira natronophila]
MFHFPFPRRKSDDTVLFGAEFTPSGVAVACIQRERGRLELLHCQFLPADKSSQREVLRDFVYRHGLAGTSCAVVLHPSQYQLLFVDRPEGVPVAELAEALRWRVKDLIQVPVAEAVIEAIALPQDAFRGRMEMTYAMVTSQQTVQETVRMVKSSGLALKFIDVGEMALRNLGLLLRSADESIGVLRLEEQGGSITLMQSDFLYLCRRIESGLASLQSSEDGEAGIVEDPNFAFLAPASDPAEGLLLEIQRSLDYYESQIGKGTVNRVFVMPVEAELPLGFLQERLGIAIERVDISKILHTDLHLGTEVQQACICAIGGALRQGGE